MCVSWGSYANGWIEANALPLLCAHNTDKTSNEHMESTSSSTCWSAEWEIWKCFGNWNISMERTHDRESRLALMCLLSDGLRPLSLSLSLSLSPHTHTHTKCCQLSFYSSNIAMRHECAPSHFGLLYILSVILPNNLCILCSFITFREEEKVSAMWQWQ